MISDTLETMVNDPRVSDQEIEETYLEMDENQASDALDLIQTSRPAAARRISRSNPRKRA